MRKVFLLFLAVIFMVGIYSESWHTQTSMPTARQQVDGDAIGNDIYIIGGLDGSSNYLSTVEIYHTVTDLWDSGASMLTARAMVTCCSYNGKLYVFGGYDADGDYSAVEMYDPGSGLWTNVTTLSVPRSDMIAEEVNGIIYVIGGQKSWASTRYDRNDAYDPVANTWEAKAPMPIANRGMGSAVVGGKIYVFGGFDAGGTTHYTLYVYDPVENTWAQKTNMSNRRRYFSGTAFNGLVYAVGGYYSDDLSSVEAYDPVLDQWSSSAAMPTARRFHAAVTVGDSFYAIGGCQDVPLSSTERYGPGEIVDTQPPVTVINIGDPSFTSGIELYICGNTPISFSVEDYSAISLTEYKIDEGAWTEYLSGDINISTLQDGNHDISFYRDDTAGNIEAVKVQSIDIDNTPPATNILIGSPKILMGDVYHITTNTPLSFTSSDTGAGVATTTYSINGGVWVDYYNNFFLDGNKGEYTIEYFSMDELGNQAAASSTIVYLEQGINAIIDFDPDSLNLHSEGVPVTVYIELESGYDVNNIDRTSIRLNNSIPCLPSLFAIGDYDNDGIPDLMVKFDRKAVQEILPTGDNVEILIQGMISEFFFSGSDTIKAFLPPYKDDNTAVLNNRIAPGNGENANIYVKMDKPGRVVIKVFTLSGKLVQTIMDKHVQEDSFEAIWNGTNIQDRIVASGVYLINIHTDNFNETQKVLIIK